jgi:hypothetical protein
MEMQNFEKKLIQMTKPEVSELKHLEMLSNAIGKAKDKSVLSWWWISIPLYIIATLLMKTIFMPGTSLISNISEMTVRERNSSILFFLIVPIVFIIINFISIRKIYFLSGSPKTLNFLSVVWFNVLIIIFSILILIIYSL